MMEPPDRNLIISESALTGNCRSYVNECFAKDGGYKLNIDDKKCNYYDSYFSKYDEYLVSAD